MVKAELELEVNKLRTEEAALRDSLLKMQALNEGLGQDKIELNKIIMQVGVFLFLIQLFTIGPRSTVSNVSGNRCKSDCRSRGL